jgi:dihydroorotate dehydrogenase (NAD+) catalytic subunit
MSHNGSLEVDIAGLQLSNPLILASGVMGTTPGGLNRVAEAGAGGAVTKSLGLEARAGHGSPNVVKVSCGYLNAMGLPNPGVKEFRKEMGREKVRTTVFASVYGEGPEEFAEVAGKIAPEADAIELNLSCPHAEKLGAAVGSDPELVEKVVREVQGELDLPVFAKLTPNVTDIREIGRAAESGGADGLVAINTLPGMAIDVNTGKPVLGNTSGGLSGRAIHPVAVKSVYELYEAVSLPIIGVGGVESGEDAVELVLAGASAVQIGTAIAHRDLKVFGEIRSDMNEYLDSKGVKLEDLVGNVHEDTVR